METLGHTSLRIEKKIDNSTLPLGLWTTTRFVASRDVFGRPVYLDFHKSPQLFDVSEALTLLHLITNISHITLTDLFTAGILASAEYADLWAYQQGNWAAGWRLMCTR